ncbi:Aspartic peptidase domain superfamily [Sergentomyia squamirostris]
MPVPQRTSLKGYLTRMEEDVGRFRSEPELTNVQEVQSLLRRVQEYETNFLRIHDLQLAAQVDRVVEHVEHEGVMARAKALREFYQRYLLDRAVQVDSETQDGAAFVPNQGTHLLNPSDPSNGTTGAAAPPEVRDDSIHLSVPVTESIRLVNLEFPSPVISAPRHVGQAPGDASSPAIGNHEVHLPNPTEVSSGAQGGQSSPEARDDSINFAVPVTQSTRFMGREFPPPTISVPVQDVQTNLAATAPSFATQASPSTLEQAIALMLQHQAQAEARTMELFSRLNESILSQSTRPANHPKLPTLQVPQFSGEPSAWPNFKDMFRAIVHNNTRITNVERLQYLVTSVTGSAKKLIENLPLTDANYEVAWNILEAQYDNKFSIIHGQIEKCCKLSGFATATVSNFTNLYTSAVSITNSLTGLGVITPDLWIIYILSAKLDNESKTQWSKEVGNKVPTLQDFFKFMGARLRSLEICHSSLTKPAELVPKGLPKPSTQNNHASVLAATANYTCPACQSTEHKIFKCSTFISMTPEARFNVIKENHLCRKCLVDTHLTKTCKFNLSCRKCQGHHSSLLHDSFYQNNVTGGSNNSRNPNALHGSSLSRSPTVSSVTIDHEEPIIEEIPSGSPTGTPVSNAAAIVSDQPGSVSDCTLLKNSDTAQSVARVFLETAIVRILDYKGVPQQCRALLDSGAQANLITQSMANRLRLPKSRSDLIVSGIVEGGTKAQYQVECNVQSLQSTEYFLMNCQLVPSILQQRIPNWSVTSTPVPIPGDKVLADPTWDISQPIDLLISNEFYNDIVQGEVLALGPDYPYLKQSVFGWVVSGPLRKNLAAPRQSHVAVTLASIDKTLKQFLGAEEIASPSRETPEELAAEAIFKSTTIRDPVTGRYVVHNLFKPNIVRLHNNLQSATKQFLSLEAKMSKDSAFRDLYHDTMREYFDREFFEVVPENDLNRPSYYMPHHPVLKKSEGPPKIRVVMNASSKSLTGLSLNDCVMVGPNVQPDIVTNLLRFRQHKVVWTCDIKQMYPQVWLHPPHRDFNRIIWRFDPKGPLQHYRAKGVCFGVASSSFLATRATTHLAQCAKTTHPEGARVLEDHAYVDDCLVSFPNTEEAAEACRQLIQLLGSAGMELAKWKTNMPNCLQGIVNEPTETLTANTQALGVEWHPITDTFHFSIPKDFSTVHTKLEALSSLASLYDPLGLIGPVIIHGKLIMQAIWAGKLGWDVPLPEAIALNWKKFYSSLPDLDRITIPRWFSDLVPITGREIHIFCDSSKYAYGAVAYVTTTNGTLSTSRLLIAKSRVAPIDGLTIPRLELSAALLGARLLQKIRDSINFSDYYMWTDSTIVLGQIRSTSLCCIGGAYPAELASSDLWWSGPDFITQEASAWPVDPSTYEPIIELPISVVMSVEVPEPISAHPLNMIMNKPIKYNKMKRILAYILRAFSHSKPKSTEILPQELDGADRMFVAFAQQEHLLGVRNALMKGGLGSGSKHASLRRLTPFLDGHGIIRVGGRLKNAPESYDVKHPMLLPKSKLASLIAEQCHLTNLHIGPQQLLSTMRQRYWPLGSRNLTRGVVRRCLRCYKHNPVMGGQMMGNLPEDRVSLSSPFTACGMDFCGPVWTRPAYKRGGVAYKTYLCVFVCFATKAVHIEVVGDLTMQSFIAAFRRFIARRSAPSDVYCDNATNLKGADNALRQLFQDLLAEPDLTNECSIKGIRFHFMPPRSPHHGGLHEAAVKALKHHLLREVGTTILTFEELATVAAQIEAILNSRPLTPLSDYADEPPVLTPAHFLVGKPLNVLPAHDFTHVPPNRLTRWQLCQKLIQHFANRWKREYLHSLQSRQKWTSDAPNLEVGDFVLVSDDNMPTYRWPVAVVEELHAGSDGKCRVVTVRTAKGTYIRAVQKVALLPIERLSRSQCGPPAGYVDAAEHSFKTSDAAGLEVVPPPLEQLGEE